MSGAVAAWRAQGFARAGPLLPEALLAALRARADDLMLGRAPHDHVFFQADGESGRYEDAPLGKGWEGPTLRYRKLEKLERDEVFAHAVLHPSLLALAREAVGPELAVCRAALFVKAARGGTELPWHQDGGAFWGLSAQPTFQVWTALDDAPLEAGCLWVAPGTHAGGLVRPGGGVLPPALFAAADDRAVAVPARAGESLLVHNLVWHRSGTNQTDLPRRALTVCFMDAATRCTRKRGPRTFMRCPDP